MTEIIQLDSLSCVDPFEWDELAKDDIQASYQWLRLIEETSASPVQIRCFLAREGKKLQAAVFLWKQCLNDRPFNVDYVLFGRLKGIARFLGAGAHPALIGGEMFGYRETVLFRDHLSLADRGRLFSLLLASAEKTARAEGRMLWFRRISKDDSGLAEMFSSRGYVSSQELPVCYLDIRWRSFAEYLRAVRTLHPGMEKSIRKEMNRSLRAGVTILQLDNPAPLSGRLHELVDAHYKRLNGCPFPCRPEFFAQLKSRMGDRVVIYTAITEERIVGVMVMLRGKGRAFLPIIGIDGEQVRRDAVYFNLGFNHPIRDAIESGLRRLYFGTQVYESKLRRGCLLSHADMYLRAGSGIGGLLLRPLLACRSWKLRGKLKLMLGRNAPGAE